MNGSVLTAAEPSDRKRNGIPEAPELGFCKKATEDEIRSTKTRSKRGVMNISTLICFLSVE